MSYLKPYDKSELGDTSRLSVFLSELPLFNMFSFQKWERWVGVQLKDQTYLDGDDEYSGLLSLFDNPVERMHQELYTNSDAEESEEELSLKSWTGNAYQCLQPQLFLPQVVPKIVFPVGISNLGNTCYMNSLLQCLVAWDELEKYIKNGMKWHGMSRSSSIVDDAEPDYKYFKLNNSHIAEHNILQSFIDAFYCLKDGEREDDKIVSFYDHLCEKFTYIFEQEDSHELLMVIFNLFNEFFKKQTLYQPRLDFMRGIKDWVVQAKQGQNKQKSQDNKEKKLTEESFKSSISTMSSSLILQSKVSDSKDTRKTDENISELLDSSVLSGFEGITNPFTGIFHSQFTCLECGDYTWSKHEIRYVVSITCKFPTIEQNIQNEMQREKIEGYRCVKCVIRETLESIRSIRQYHSVNELEQFQMLLEEFNNKKEVDEDEFMKAFNSFRIKSQINDEYIRLATPSSTIIRDTFLTKAPKILWIHINRLSDFDPFGNIIKNNKFIKFPQILKLNNCFGDQFCQQYELKSVAEHFGGSGGGHFTAMRKINWKTDNIKKANFDESKASKSKSYIDLMSDYSESGINIQNPGTWVSANDENIRFVSLHEVLSRNAYMIFYERIQTD